MEFRGSHHRRGGRSRTTVPPQGWTHTPRTTTRSLRSPVVVAEGTHPVTFRTRKLSPPAPMVLPGQPGGRVGRRGNLITSRPPPSGGGLDACPDVAPVRARGRRSGMLGAGRGHARGWHGEAAGWSPTHAGPGPDRRTTRPGPTRGATRGATIDPRRGCQGRPRQPGEPGATPGERGQRAAT
jgi:hypothetical protein